MTDISSTPTPKPRRARARKTPAQIAIPGPRTVLGIDPGQTGGAVLLWTGPGAVPQVLAAWAWSPVTRAGLSCLCVQAVAGSGPSGAVLPSLGAVGDLIGRIVAEVGGRFDAVAIEAPQSRPGIPGAGLAVARAAGELAGGVCARWAGRVLWPTPSAWRAVAYPGRERTAGKPDPSGIVAQTAGWPDGAAALWPGGVPEHTAEALGVALWAAVQGPRADVRAGAKAKT